MARGGKRSGAGRKPLGVTKRRAITLPEEIWGLIEADSKKYGSEAAVFREIVLKHYEQKKEKE